MTAAPVSALRRVFVSPGPIYEPEGRRPDYWRFARALFAAGFRAGDLVHNTFSYHLTPAGAMVESGAEALGCPVIPAGTGQTEQQLRTIADLRPVGYVGTPSFLKVLLDRAASDGGDVSSLKKALVGAEALPSALRAEFRSRGLGVLQCYGTADIGIIAYESTSPQGELCDGMVVDEGIILELVQPGTGEPVAPGEVGEVVVTTLTPEYPLIRFATGDLSAMLPGASPCGRTNHRIKGWLGRADQTTKVRGMFVHPEQVAEIVRRHKSIIRARLVVERPRSTDEMTLLVEVGEPARGSGADRRNRAGGNQAARHGQPRAGGQPARRRQADRGSPAIEIKFIEWSQFFQTEVPIESLYCMRKVDPYRFVPQTSYSVEQLDRGHAAPVFPHRSRLFACRAL